MIPLDVLFYQIGCLAVAAARLAEDVPDDWARLLEIAPA